MKVLHVLQSNRFSGAENVVCQIISIMNTEGIESVYCSSDGQIREALEERNITFCPIRKMTLSEFKRVIKEVKPDVIHAHDMKASFFTSLVCGRIPLVSHIHNNSFDSRGISLKSILYLTAGLKAKHIFWVSKSAFSGYCFHKIFSNKSTILYNIININDLKEKMIADPEKYEYDVVFLGRLSEPKNPERLVDVFDEIAAMCPQANMAVIGTGELDEKIRKLVSKKRLDNRVHFLGFRSNPYKILHDAKVMIMTSKWEGTPMCALEAMSLGVPIVSTPTDGLCELVEDGKTGYLSNENHVLAKRIVEILEDREKQKKLSDNATKKAYTMMDFENYKNIIRKEYDGCFK